MSIVSGCYINNNDLQNVCYPLAKPPKRAIMNLSNLYDGAGEQLQWLLVFSWFLFSTALPMPRNLHLCVLRGATLFLFSLKHYLQNIFKHSSK